MRKLIGDDFFNAARAVAASGMRFRLAEIRRKISAGEKNVERVGFDTILSLIEGFAMPGAEKAVYAFLAGPLEMDGDEIGNLPILDLIAKMGIVFQDEGFLPMLGLAEEFGAEELLDFVFRRFGGGAAEFLKMPAKDACSLIRFSANEDRREKLWQRWIAAGQNVPFADFAHAVQPAKFRDEDELIADIERMTAGGVQNGNI